MTQDEQREEDFWKRSFATQRRTQRNMIIALSFQTAALIIQIIVLWRRFHP